MALPPRLEYAVVVMVVKVDLNAERRRERLVEEGIILSGSSCSHHVPVRLGSDASGRCT